ncbi:GNAT family N-acetyltransferase [bacterium]|nr:GNAT family N-acetyltransferase [candidate division CSSED10-310 bacterium]
MNDHDDIMKQKAVFRKMRFPEDRDVLYAIHEAYDKEYELTRNRDEYRVQMEFYALHSAIYHPLVLTVGDQPAGYIRAYDRISMSSCDVVLMLDLVYILPGFRGMGFGRLLMEQFLAFSEKINAVRIDLLADRDNEAAVELYKSMGFKGRNRYQMIRFMRSNTELEAMFERKKDISG